MTSIIEQAFKAYDETLSNLELAFSALPTSSTFWNKFEGKVKDAANALGLLGWYFDMKLPPNTLFLLHQAITEGNQSFVDDALSQYFEKHFSRIERNIVRKFPNRKKIIKSAFRAHGRKEYELSIPVLFAQTDGICLELFGKQLFLKNGKDPQTAVYVRQMVTNTFLQAILQPISIDLPISWNKEKRKSEDYAGLNRHEVLHGESTCYGTKENSLKAISLINFIACQKDFIKTP